jgi:hypothetical protein
MVRAVTFYVYSLREIENDEKKRRSKEREQRIESFQNDYS